MSCTWIGSLKTLGIFFLVAGLQWSCGNQPDQQKDQDLPSPEFNLSDGGLRGLETGEQSFYGSTSIWDPQLQPETLAEIIEAVKSARSTNLEYEKTKAKNERVNSELVNQVNEAEKKIEELRGVLADVGEAEQAPHYRPIWEKFALEKAAGYFEELLDLQLSEEEKNRSRRVFREYCEGVLWQYAVSDALRLTSYSNRPTPLIVCESAFAENYVPGMPQLLNIAEESCQDAAEGTFKSYMQCFWEHGVVKTRFFREQMQGCSSRTRSIRRCKNTDSVKDSFLKKIETGKIEEVLANENNQIESFRTSTPRIILQKKSGPIKTTEWIQAKTASEQDTDFTKIYSGLKIANLLAADNTVSDVQELDSSIRVFTGVDAAINEAFFRSLIKIWIQDFNMIQYRLNSESTLRNISRHEFMFNLPKADIEGAAFAENGFLRFLELDEPFHAVFGAPLTVRNDPAILQEIVQLEASITDWKGQISRNQSEYRNLGLSWLNKKVQIAVNYHKKGAALALWDQVRVKLIKREGDQYEVQWLTDLTKAGELSHLRGCFNLALGTSVSCDTQTEVAEVPMQLRVDPVGSIHLDFALDSAKEIGMFYSSNIGSVYTFNLIPHERLFGHRVELNLYPRELSEELIILTGDGKILDAQNNEVYHLAMDLSQTVFRP